MKKHHLVFLCLLTVAFSANAVSAPGSTAESAAYSGKQIKVFNPAAPSGVYYFDVDGAGPLVAFQSYADMITDGGGWTLVHDRSNSLPDMDGFAASVLNVYGPSSFWISSNSTNTFYNSGDAGQSAALSIALANPAQYTVFVRENNTPAYVAAVPEPETYAMLLSGLGLMGFIARRRKQQDNA